MLNFRQTILLFLLIIQIPSFGQKQIIDSLKMLLKTNVNDSIRLNVHQDILNYYQENKDLNEFFENLRIAKKDMSYRNLPRAQGSLLNTEGLLEMRHGNMSKAQKCFIEAIDIFKSLKKYKSISAVAGNLSLVFFRQNKFELALKYANIALEYANKIKNNKELVSNIYINLGSICGAQNDYKMSKVYFDKALILYEELNDSLGISYCYNNLAMVATSAKDLKRAKRYYERALELKNKTNSDYDRSTAYNNLAKCELLLNENKSALKHLKIALEIIDTALHIPDLLELYQNLSQVYKRNKDYEKAYYFQDLMFKIERKVTKENSNEEMVKMELESVYKSKTVEDSLKFSVKQEVQNSKMKAANWQRFGLLGVFLISLIGGFIINKRLRISRNQNVIIQSQKLEVEDKNKQIIDSINYAHRIQKSLLVSNDVLNHYLPNHFLFFQPKDIVSGDFYWATVTPNYFYFAICDSTGHGVPGAFMSLLNMSFLNEAVIEKKIEEPNEILNYVRDRLLVSLPQGQDGMDATLLKFALNEQNQIDYKQPITFSAANNEPILVRNYELTKLQKDKMAVGKSYSSANFTNFEVTLEKGDRFYIYTDGFADQFGGDAGKKFKSANLNSLLTDNSNKIVGTQLALLESSFSSWKGQQEQVDDVCVIGITV